MATIILNPVPPKVFDAQKARLRMLQLPVFVQTDCIEPGDTVVFQDGVSAKCIRKVPREEYCAWAGKMGFMVIDGPCEITAGEVSLVYETPTWWVEVLPD